MRDLREDFVNRARLSSRDLYGKRVGRALKPNQAMRVETLLPKLQIPLDITRQQSPTDWFTDTDRPVFLEIGFGAGEHLAELAQRHRDINFIGVEYYLNGVAKLLEYIDRFDLKNVRVHHGDGRDVLEVLPEASISRLFVLQPDPWPKRRHWDRRIIHRDNLPPMARCLKQDAVLKVSTDHQGYLPFMLQQLQASPHFDWTARTADDWRIRPDDWPDSRYAAKGRAEGRKITYLIYRRNTERVAAIKQ